MAQNPVNQLYGVTASEWEIIQQILAQFKHIKEVRLFGSRAKSTYKPGSDIDLAILGASITKDDISSLLAAFEDSLLPYFVDILSYSTITNQALKEHIDRIGITIYRNESTLTSH